MWQFPNNVRRMPADWPQGQTKQCSDLKSLDLNFSLYMSNVKAQTGQVQFVCRRNMEAEEKAHLNKPEDFWNNVLWADMELVWPWCPQTAVCQKKKKKDHEFLCVPDNCRGKREAIHLTVELSSKLIDVTGQESKAQQQICIRMTEKEMNQGFLSDPVKVQTSVGQRETRLLFFFVSCCHWACSVWLPYKLRWIFYRQL